MSNFRPIYRSVCRLAGKGAKRIGIIGGLPRLSTTRERVSAYQQAIADCGLPEDESLIRYGNSMEDSAHTCLNELLQQKCDAIIVCQGLMGGETIIHLHKRGIRLGQDIDLVSFVDYDSGIYQLYENQMDSIIQPVEELGLAAIWPRTWNTTAAPTSTASRPRRSTCCISTRTPSRCSATPTARCAASAWSAPRPRPKAP